MQRKSDRKNPIKKTPPTPEKRARIVYLCMCLTLVIVGLRATQLQVFPSARQKLQQIADRQYQKEIKTAPWRGSFYDRRSIPLAVSVKKSSIAINPKVFTPTSQDVDFIAKTLAIPKSKIMRLAERDVYFRWLARKRDPETVQKIIKLKLPGLREIKEPFRYYPGDSLAAQTLGKAGLDNDGLFGLEQAMDGIIKGSEFSREKGIDAKGRSLYQNSQNALPESLGNDVYLTLDRVIQEQSELALAKAVEGSKAKSGFAIVMDPYSGSILALASLPNFNPNDQRIRSMTSTINRGVADRFEPGSVVKAFSIASAIDQGHTNVDEIYNCENGKLKIGRNTIKDDHPKEELTTSETLIHSSNICAYKIAQKLGRGGLRKSFESFGIGVVGKSLELPGNQQGYMANSSNWREIRFANIAFGQGLVSTGLEIAAGFATLVNGGKLMRPRLVDTVRDSSGSIITRTSPKILKHVISEKTSEQMRDMMERVVLEGTAIKAASLLYSTGGKTGTAEKVDQKLKRYSETKRFVSFAGFAPVKEPRLVVYVGIDEPGVRPFYGGYWAGPVFAEIVTAALQYLNVAPDKGLTINTTAEGKDL